jgi:tRNA threonylcarbamoyladenosine biosynthesis protein TsaE
MTVKREGDVALTVVLPDADATRDLGERLAQLVKAGDLVILSGELGAGKTTLVQGLGRGLGVRGRISSPTFIIARWHPPMADGPGLVHVDAYRLGSVEELDALDLDTAVEQSVTVVEWGEGIAETLAPNRLEVALARPRGKGNSPEGAENLSGRAHRATIRGIGPRWEGIDLGERLAPPAGAEGPRGALGLPLPGAADCSLP